MYGIVQNNKLKITLHGESGKKGSRFVTWVGLPL